MPKLMDRPASGASNGEPLWPLYAVLASSAAIVTGLIWDISWHRSIGRDTFWSPPHVLEQLAAVVAGVACGVTVLRMTFRATPEEQGFGVRFWGFRGPSGAWLCIWGALMMVASAPFDDWWHNAYGLDVKIISPPHMVLAWGMIAIQVGTMLMALARQNRADPRRQRRLSLIYAASAGILLTMHATVLLEEAAFPNHMRRAEFYLLTAIGFPLILLATSRPSRLRWPATTTAAIYTGIVLVIMWTLQLFPATPLLAPIYNPVTRMVPPPFPLLLIVPAIVFDIILRHRVRRQRGTLGAEARTAAILAVTFVALMFVVHWWWGELQLTPFGRNFIIAADRWDYNVTVGAWRYEFWDAVANIGELARALGVSVVIAAITSFVGLTLGSRMSRVQR
jgi:hypothetical protein